jgi:hypothetical protein
MLYVYVYAVYRPCSAVFNLGQLLEKEGRQAHFRDEVGEAKEKLSTIDGLPLPSNSL